MSFVPCAVCADRPKGKLIWTAWVWYTADNQRVAYRLSLCQPCFQTMVLPIIKSVEAAEEMLCVGCGGSVQADLDGTYLTVAAPSAGKLQFELPYDSACAAKARIAVMHGGSRLEDRREVKGQETGPSPAPSSFDVWAALGLNGRG
jgi:hypothetical protein